MMKIYLKCSSIWIYPYYKGQVPYLEKLLSVWDTVLHHYTQRMYCFDKENNEKYGVLKLPKGIGIETVENAVNDLGIEYTIINREDDFPDIKTINVPMKRDPLDDIQYESISFLNKNANKHQMFLTLDVGMGKTYCVVKHISEMKKCAMIISFNLSYQWEQRIEDYTELKTGKDVISIVGTQYLEDVIHGKVKPDASIYIVTINTLSKLMELYGYEELQKLADKLNIGIKVFDEAHNRYKMFNEIDLNMQVDETIYVTATPGRSRTEEDKMYAKMYRAIPAYGSWTSKLNNHYIIKHVTINSYASASDRLSMKTVRGLMSSKYTKYLIDKYYDQMMKIMEMYLLPILKEDNNGKVLIVTDLLQTITQIKEWFSKHHPEYSIGTYCLIIDNKSEREKQLENRIILGTVGSMQNGKDIANLRAIFPLTQFSSQIVTKQLLGRLRPLKDGRKVYYFDLADRSVPDTMRQRFSRDKVFRDRADGEIMEDLIDMEHVGR